MRFCVAQREQLLRHAGAGICLCAMLVSFGHADPEPEPATAARDERDARNLIDSLVTKNEASRRRTKSIAYHLDWQISRWDGNGELETESNRARVIRDGGKQFTILERSQTAILPDGTRSPQRVTQFTVVADDFSADYQSDSRYARQVDHASIAAISEESTSRMETFGPPDPLAYAFGSGEPPLREALAPKKGVRSTVEEVVPDGADGPVFRVTRFRGNPERPYMICTIDPARGHLVTNVRFYTRSGELGIEHTVDVEAGGTEKVWVPTRVVTRTYKAWHFTGGGKGGGKPEAPHDQGVMTLENLAVNQPVPAGTFTMASMGLTPPRRIVRLRLNGTKETLHPPDPRPVERLDNSSGL